MQKSSGSPRQAIIVASNLHSGGAVQVAASLLNELASVDEHSNHPSGIREFIAGYEIIAEVSDAVESNLTEKARGSLRLTVRNRHPHTMRFIAADLRNHFDIAFVVFGPYYFPLRADRKVMGFADVTSVYPPPVDERFTTLVRRTIRTYLSLTRARSVNALIVETDAISARLSERNVNTSTHVISNTLNQQIAATEHANRRRLRGNSITLLYVARDYPHKNLAFLPKVAETASLMNITIQFLVTLRQDEWNRQTSSFHRTCHNLGELNIDQLVDAYDRADGVFFPSLLEAQSATPIEALALGVPLFCSNLDFSWTTSGDSAWYFDPHDPADAVATICAAIASPDEVARKINSGRQVAASMPSATDRFNATIGVLTQGNAHE